jgi:NADPH:quinone reductase-like Zn-dependent oxidoreductase
VIQLAKADGLKVIASAGSDEKVAFMKEVGADVAFNYKTTSVRDVLSKEGPINMCVANFSLLSSRLISRIYSFWDHVGGETLEAALDAADIGARFIVSGQFWPGFPAANSRGDIVSGMRNDQWYVFSGFRDITLSPFLSFRIQHRRHTYQSTFTVQPHLHLRKTKSI